MKIDTLNNEIVGYNPDRQSAQLGPDLPNFKGYFVIRFNCDIKDFGCWNDSILYPGAEELYGTRMGAYINFSQKDKEIKARKKAERKARKQAKGVQ